MSAAASDKTQAQRESSFIPFLRVWLPAALWQERWLQEQPPLPDQRIVMFHIGRSGSTVLADLLDQHPQVEWAGEVVRKLYAPFERRGWSIKPRVDSRRLLIDSIAQNRARFYGCELKFFHLTQLGINLEQCLATLDATAFQHYILLERKNHLRKIVSSVVARKRKRYRQPAGVDPELTRITLDPEHVQIDGTDHSLIALLRAYADDIRCLEQLTDGKHFLKLTYEDDILPDPRIGYQQVCEFLGIEQAAVDVKYGRSNPFPLRDILANYDQVASTLAGTEFAWMLESA